VKTLNLADAEGSQAFGFNAHLRTRVLASFSKFWQVVANGSDTRGFTDSFTDSGHSARRNSLMHTHQNLEARVGIEPSNWMMINCK